jgi:hypothetical protein
MSRRNQRADGAGGVADLVLCEEMFAESANDAALRLLGRVAETDEMGLLLVMAWCSRGYRLVVNNSGKSGRSVRLELPWGWRVIDSWHDDFTTDEKAAGLAYSVQRQLRELLGMKFEQVGFGTDVSPALALVAIMEARAAVEYSGVVDEVSDLCVAKVAELELLCTLAVTYPESAEVAAGVAESWTGTPDDLFIAVGAACS